MRVHFITACRNVERNVEALLASVREQKNENWLHTIVDDCSHDGTPDRLEFLSRGDRRIRVVRNNDRLHALRNIVETSRKVERSDIIATLDGDDALCNSRTVDLLLQAYEDGADVAWTAHKWDTNGMNISGYMPDKVDPYAWPWVSSHLRTFRARLLEDVTDANFLDHNGVWFKRGYDQALMLPVLRVGGKRTFIPDVCYRYNIDSASIPAAERNWSETAQISTVNIVRSRGFLK